MKVFTSLDPDDPLASSLKSLKRQAMRLLVISLAAIGIAVFVGVPHLQTTYRYAGSSSRSIPPERREKLSAYYIGPFGWQQLDRSESGGRLTAIEFIPLHRCIDFKRLESVFPFSLLPLEYRDGRPAR